MTKNKMKIVPLIIIAFIVLLGFTFGIIDYNRVKNDQMPIFVVAQHDKGGPEIAYYGLGYKVVRNPGVSYKEDISMDNYVKFGFWFYAWEIKSHIEDPTINNIINVNVVKTEHCDNQPKLYYSEETKNIYIYCLDSITVSDKSNSMELKNYIEVNSNALNFIIDNFTKEPEASYDDGGTKLYSGNTFNVLKCHTLDGNMDIYIGNKNMGYGRGFCGR
jgi:hypothetical protein